MGKRGQSGEGGAWRGTYNEQVSKYSISKTTSIWTSETFSSYVKCEEKHLQDTLVFLMDLQPIIRVKTEHLQLQEQSPRLPFQPDCCTVTMEEQKHRLTKPPAGVVEKTLNCMLKRSGSGIAVNPQIEQLLCVGKNSQATLKCRHVK